MGEFTRKDILNAAKLMASPQVYAMFLLWMLSEIYELLPEAGDLPKPKLVFFFDGRICCSTTCLKS